MRAFWGRLYEWECMVFHLFNRQYQRKSLSFFLTKLTHIGGARMTILTVVLLMFFAPVPYNLWARESALALLLSHLPVQLIKRMFKRLRPYLALPNTNVVQNPLKDHSFPSGHSTAIFSVTTPFMVHDPMLILILLPVALIVASSRIFLGLHYPSDVLAGCVLGSVTGILCTFIL